MNGGRESGGGKRNSVFSSPVRRCERVALARCLLLPSSSLSSSKPSSATPTRRRKTSNKMLQTRPCSSSSAAAAARCFPLDSRARCVSSLACAAAWPRRPPQARWQRARQISLRSSMVVASASSSEEGRSSPSSSSSSSLPAEISRGVPWPRRLLGGRIDDSEGSVKDVRRGAL